MIEPAPLPITEREVDDQKVSWEITVAGKRCYLKRNLSPAEFAINPFCHRVIAPIQGANNLRNEKLAIDYVRSNTSIPVPEVIFYLDEGDRVYFGTEEVEGITFSEVEDPKDRQKVIEQIDAIVQELETHRSSTIRGFGHDVCFPPAIWPVECPSAPEHFIEVDTQPFVLCHGDLHGGNVIVDPDSMKIKAVIDWEYAGWYPPVIDPRRYKLDDRTVVHADGSVTPYAQFGRRERDLLESFSIHQANKCSYSPGMTSARTLATNRLSPSLDLVDAEAQPCLETAPH